MYLKCDVIFSETVRLDVDIGAPQNDQIAAEDQIVGIIVDLHPVTFYSSVSVMKLICFIKTGP